jgi:hypothetical protein
MGAFSRCRPKPGEFYPFIFLTIRKNKSKRFNFNLKALNEFIEVPHFKLEDIRTTCKLITKNCYKANLDLKNADFLVLIDKKY